MQVTVETTRGLERKLTVHLPGERFENACDKRLKSLAKSARIDGFRPGKVPLSVIRRKYGASVQQEVLADLIQESYGQALSEKELTPAGLPHIDSTPPADGEDMVFTAVFEVYPSVQLGDLGKLKAVRPQVEITDSDVDEAIDKIRRQRATFEPVEREARKGDQVTIDFQGTVGGEPFQGGQAEDFQLVLGEGRMIEGFESELEGIRAGDRRKIKVKFPKDYAEESLQGKKAVFEVDCKAVLEPRLPALDAEFARSLGVDDGSTDALRDRIRDYLERERDEAARARVREQLFEALAQMHKIDLPNVLVDEEIEQLQRQAARQLGLKEEDLGRLPREGFEEQARRRVHLGLLLGELIRDRGIKADRETVRRMAEQAVAGYPNREQMLEYMLNDRETMRRFESMAVEEKAVEVLLDQAKVTDKPMSFNELVNRNQGK